MELLNTIFLNDPTTLLFSSRILVKFLMKRFKKYYLILTCIYTCKILQKDVPYYCTKHFYIYCHM